MKGPFFRPRCHLRLRGVGDAVHVIGHHLASALGKLVVHLGAFFLADGPQHLRQDAQGACDGGHDGAEDELPALGLFGLGSDLEALHVADLFHDDVLNGAFDHALKLEHQALGDAGGLLILLICNYLSL